jgi:hypothetical protein
MRSSIRTVDELEDDSSPRSFAEQPTSVLAEPHIDGLVLLVPHLSTQADLAMLKKSVFMLVLAC